MMAGPMVSRDAVIEYSRSLPSFPRVVTDILASLDDPDGNLNVLVRIISLDPIIAARVLSVANMASVRGRRESEVSDIYTATSLIGLGRVREIALISSMGAFVESLSLGGMPSSFWTHSVSVGVCAGELVRYVAVPVSNDEALVAGLLHDIGQLWFYIFDAPGYEACWHHALAGAASIDEAERAHFGVDHSIVGGWLAEHWELPQGVVAAIRNHHSPDGVQGIPLVPLLHVAEVLSNALDLAGRDENRVTYLSRTACRQLGLVWDDDVRALFGRMEARSRHANAFFHL